jgi:HPt (histidine-containing phosphotransfer) domain-containing protein
VMEEDRQRCLDAGMQGFLPKPMRIDELSEVLDSYANATDDSSEPHNSDLASTVLRSGTAPANQPALIDWTRLEQFRELDDDNLSLTREVIALFSADTPQRIEGIQQALRACDSGALSVAAHALLGAASNVGAQGLANACTALEQSCAKGRWPQDAAHQVEQLIRCADQTRVELQNFKL